MKIVQSFWSGNKDCLKDSYGWSSPIYHYASWILSCNQLRKYYDDVILVTDKVGYDILINRLPQFGLSRLYFDKLGALFLVRIMCTIIHPTLS